MILIKYLTLKISSQNTLISIFILAALTFSLNTNGQVNHTNYVFCGRYVEWKNVLSDPNDDGPFPTSSIYTLDPLIYIKGFYDKIFTLTVLYDDSVAARNGWVSDIQAASSDWNNSSNYAQVSIDPLGQVVSEPIWEFPSINTIALSSSASSPLFAPGSKAVGKAYLYHIYSNSCTSDPSTTWTKGSVIVGADIFFNVDKYQFFTGSGPAGPFDYSVKSITMHELGHLLGLNHHPYIGKRRVMHKSHSSNKVKQLQPEDITAINRLYGYDGLNQGSDPFYSSIPCDAFNPVIQNGLLATSSDGEDDDVAEGIELFNSDPCNNCVKDPNEDGIDCGIFSGCGDCSEICTGTINSLYISKNSTPIPDYNLVKNTISISPDDNIIVSAGDFKYFKAGQSIEIIPSASTGSFSIEKFVDSELLIGTCDCPNICLLFLPNIITPDCDGINDFLFFHFNGADEYEFTVANRNGPTVFSESGTITGSRLYAWNGITSTGAPVADGEYFYRLTLKSSCDDSELIATSSLAVLGAKECMNENSPPTQLVTYSNNDPMQVDTKGHNNKAFQLNNPSPNKYIKVYPNPFESQLSIESVGEYITQLTVIDAAGNHIYSQNNIKSNSLSPSISNMISPGEYILLIKTNLSNYNVRIIKK